MIGESGKKKKMWDVTKPLLIVSVGEVWCSFTCAHCTLAVMGNLNSELPTPRAVETPGLEWRGDARGAVSHQDYIDFKGFILTQCDCQSKLLEHSQEMHNSSALIVLRMWAGGLTNPAIGTGKGIAHFVTQGWLSLGTQTVTVLVKGALVLK